MNWASITEAIEGGNVKMLDLQLHIRNTEDVLPEVKFSSIFALKLWFDTIMLNKRTREEKKSMESSK